MQSTKKRMINLAAATDSAGAGEKEHYGAVVRGQNVYVRPSAHKPSLTNSWLPDTACVDSAKDSVLVKDGNAVKDGELVKDTGVAKDGVMAKEGMVTKDSMAAKDKVVVPKVAVNTPDKSTVLSKMSSPALTKALSKDINDQMQRKHILQRMRRVQLPSFKWMEPLAFRAPVYSLGGTKLLREEHPVAWSWQFLCLVSSQLLANISGASPLARSLRLSSLRCAITSMPELREIKASAMQIHAFFEAHWDRFWVVRNLWADATVEDTKTFPAESRFLLGLPDILQPNCLFRRGGGSGGEVRPCKETKAKPGARQAALDASKALAKAVPNKPITGSPFYPPMLSSVLKYRAEQDKYLRAAAEEEDHYSPQSSRTGQFCHDSFPWTKGRCDPSLPSFQLQNLVQYLTHTSVNIYPRSMWEKEIIVMDKTVCPVYWAFRKQDLPLWHDLHYVHDFYRAQDLVAKWLQYLDVNRTALSHPKLAIEVIRESQRTFPGVDVYTVQKLFFMADKQRVKLAQIKIFMRERVYLISFMSDRLDDFIENCEKFDVYNPGFTPDITQAGHLGTLIFGSAKFDTLLITTMTMGTSTRDLLLTQSAPLARYFQNCMGVRPSTRLDLDKYITLETGSRTKWQTPFVYRYKKGSGAPTSKTIWALSPPPPQPEIPRWWYPRPDEILNVKQHSLQHVVWNIRHVGYGPLEYCGNAYTIPCGGNGRIHSSANINSLLAAHRAPSQIVPRSIISWHIFGLERKVKKPAENLHLTALIKAELGKRKRLISNMDRIWTMAEQSVQPGRDSEIVPPMKKRKHADKKMVEKAQRVSYKEHKGQIGGIRAPVHPSEYRCYSVRLATLSA
ncbi:hypothetical protein K488DRAFT_74761 [Vararia minispora EC-137]|uniref:Uncharacterized protein n=1 Tax=Vararia minispora EC-137 TaxID=1314806 RepID=A0ACB8Q6A0_9AGAM|nr:hypothetical protein K488DRAFT_74761 [Vararia minispora EC-137]